MSAYATSLEHTMIAIDRRARRFRKLLVAVLCISVTAVVVAVLARTPSALTCLLFVVPACAIYFIADAIVVNEWRLTLLRAWVAREVDFVTLIPGLRSHPTALRSTVEGMLMTLPCPDELAAEQRLSSATRRGVAAVVLSRQNSEADALVLSAIFTSVGAVMLNVAVWMWVWWPLIALLLILLSPAVYARAYRRRTAQCDAAVAAIREDPCFDEVQYLRVSQMLDQA